VTTDARVAAIADGLLDWGVERFAHVPSAQSAPLIRALVDRGVVAMLANREDEAIAIAGGACLAGARAAVVMQDNGFGNALTALATFAVAYHVPLPIIANTRGGIGAYNSMIHSVSGAVPAMLAAIPVFVERLPLEAPAAAWRATVHGAAVLAATQHRPTVVLFDLLHPAGG